MDYVLKYFFNKIFIQIFPGFDFPLRAVELNLHAKQSIKPIPHLISHNFVFFIFGKKLTEIIQKFLFTHFV